MKDYNNLTEKARELGLNWVFNSVDGLEFAIEFFSKKETSKPEHDFGYNRTCKRCGISQVQLMNMPRKYRGDGECYSYRCIQNYGVTLQELINGDY